MDVKDKIRSCRESIGISQNVLAMRSCVSRDCIIRLESTGECRPAQLRRIMSVLGMESPEDDTVSVDRGVREHDVVDARTSQRHLMNSARHMDARRRKRVHDTVDILEMS